MQQSHNTSQGGSRGVCPRIAAFVAELLMGRRDERTSRAIPPTAVAGTTDHSRAWEEEDQKNGVYVPVQRHGPVIVSVSPGTKQDQNDKKSKKQPPSNDTIEEFTEKKKIEEFIQKKRKCFNEEDKKKPFNK